MHIIAALAAALLFQATPVPSAAPAQTSQPAQQAQPVQPADFGAVLTSVNSLGVAVAKVRALDGTTVNNIRPVNVSTLGGANPAALSSALARNKTQLAALRSTLQKTTVTTNLNQRITLAQFLEDNRISVAQVVGADVANGNVLLYYQKP